MNSMLKTIDQTDDGFLINSADWNRDIARELASQLAITLTDCHWELIDFIRDYYQQYDYLPNNRLFIKAVQKAFGDEKGGSRYLNGLFDGSPVRNVCFIGGLPKPPGCL
jgi:tRNA 2-thiouridine synthesizing protein E